MMDGVPIRKLFVRNFANRTTSEDLRNYFSMYGNVEKCYLRGNRGKSNCAFVTFTNVADAVRTIQYGSRKRIHDKDLSVMPAGFRLQPDGMEQRLYNLRKESRKKTNKTSERRIANEQYSQKYLQNGTKSVSIHMLNDDCLRHIFVFLPIADRVHIEIVCKRWRDLSQHSWHMIKMLDLSRSTWGFSYNHKIRTDLLHKILLKCGRFLTYINLSHEDHNLSQSTLNIIAKLCPNLTNIDVTGLRVCLSGIRALANNCRNITKFNLGYSRHRCDDELKYFFTLNQKLEYLAISRSNISGESLLCLPEQTMHTIILEHCNNLRDNHLSMALKRLENLKHLTISVSSGVTDRTLEVIGQHCKNLRALELGRLFPIPDMSYLIHLVDLQILKIIFNPKVSDGFLADLVKHCQQLTLLDITGCAEVSDAGLAAVARLVRLENLIVSCMQRITDDGLKNMCGLKELECRECRFTDRGMSTFIKSSPQLQFLDLLGCWNITDATLEVAKHACSNRTNNVILRMIVAGTSLTKIKIERLPPLLHIVKPWWKKFCNHPDANILLKIL